MSRYLHLTDILHSSFQRSADKKTNFLKISAPWDILARYAEIMNLKMPIKVGRETDA